MVEINRIRESTVIAFASIAFFLVGLAIAFFFGLKTPFAALGFSQEVNLLLLTLAVFVFSMLFFGRLTQFFFVLVGLSQAGQIATMPLVVIFNAVPLFLAGFAGTLFGNYLLDDMEGTDNLYNYKIELLKWFGISIAAALVLAFLNPQIVAMNSAVFYVLGLQ